MALFVTTPAQVVSARALDSKGTRMASDHRPIRAVVSVARQP
ncbi:hypothetical protein [Pseudorhodobacter antarcticus]|nr:hypothetical protein [Pseudorhodobacter antarcticus]